MNDYIFSDHKNKYNGRGDSDMKPAFFSSRLIFKNGIEGCGVFVTENIKKGQVIFKMKGEIIKHPTRTSVQIGKNEHIEDEIAGRVNHNCHPNAKVNRKTQSFVSLRNIKKGEEITFNYNDNEDLMATPFICHCCNKLIAGKKADATHDVNKVMKKILVPTK